MRLLCPFYCVYKTAKSHRLALCYCAVLLVCTCNHLHYGVLSVISSYSVPLRHCRIYVSIICGGHVREHELYRNSSYREESFMLSFWLLLRCAGEKKQTSWPASARCCRLLPIAVLSLRENHRMHVPYYVRFCRYATPYGTLCTGKLRHWGGEEQEGQTTGVHTHTHSGLDAHHWAHMKARMAMAAATMRYAGTVTFFSSSIVWA